MTKQNYISKLDNEKTVFVGIDIHKVNLHLTIIQSEVVMFRGTLGNNDREIRSFFQKLSEFKLSTAYESGPCGYQLHYLLTELGINNIVVPPNKILSDGSLVKTDALDSKKLAFHLSKGILPSIRVPSLQETVNRQPVRVRNQIAKEKRRLITQIKSSCLFFGIDLDCSTGLPQETRAKLIKQNLPAELKSCLKIQLKLLSALEKEIKKLEELAVKCLSKKKSDRDNLNNLMKIGGLGKLSAATLVGEIGDPHRFTNNKQIGCFLGLTPREYSSGEKQWKGSITGQSSKALRALLIEIAWRFVRSYPKIDEYYCNLHTRLNSKKKAIVAIARKLGIIIVRIMKTGEDFQPSKFGSLPVETV
jgi:transposase